MMTLKEYKDIVVNNESDLVFLQAEHSRLNRDLRDLRVTLESCCATLQALTVVMGQKWVDTHYDRRPMDRLKKDISFYQACLAFVEERL